MLGLWMKRVLNTEIRWILCTVFSICGHYTLRRCLLETAPFGGALIANHTILRP